MNLVSWLVYVPLQVVWLPLSMLGGIWVGWKQMVVSKRLGVSQTAIEVLNGRWTLHLFGLRVDQATDRLARVLPNTSRSGLFLALLPLWVKWKISGQHSIFPRKVEPGEEDMRELVTARATRFDGIIERVLAEGAEQFVLLGAGYDTRAYSVGRRDGLATFEVDQDRVQSHKRAMVEEAGLDTSGVRFVTVDFSRDDLFTRLVEAGFDTNLKTLYLWEGVTLYLSERAVRETMRTVRDHSVPGSVLLADLYGNRLIEKLGGKVLDAALDWTDEGIRFGLPLEQGWESCLHSFVESESFEVGEHWFLGSSSKTGPFSVVVEMRI